MPGAVFSEIVSGLAQAHPATATAIDAIQHLIDARPLRQPPQLRGKELLQRLAASLGPALQGGVNIVGKVSYQQVRHAYIMLSAALWRQGHRAGMTVIIPCSRASSRAPQAAGLLFSERPLAVPGAGPRPTGAAVRSQPALMAERDRAHAAATYSPAVLCRARVSRSGCRWRTPMAVMHDSSDGSIPGSALVSHQCQSGSQRGDLPWPTRHRTSYGAAHNPAGPPDEWKREVSNLWLSLVDLGLEPRCTDFFKWYTDRLQRFEHFARRRYQRLRIPAVVVATVVPAVAAVDLGRPGRLTAAALSAFVAAALGVEVLGIGPSLGPLPRRCRGAEGGGATLPRTCRVLLPLPWLRRRVPAVR